MKHTVRTFKTRAGKDVSFVAPVHEDRMTPAQHERLQRLFKWCDLKDKEYEARGLNKPRKGGSSNA